MISKKYQKKEEENMHYPNDSHIKNIPPGNFEMLSSLNSSDLSGLKKKINDFDHYSV